MIEKNDTTKHASHRDTECDLRDQLLNAIELANLGLWEWYIENDYVNLNQKSYDITGIVKTTYDHTMKSLIKDIIHDESRADFVKALSLANKNGVISNAVYRINHPSIASCWLKFRSQLKFKNNKPFVLSGVLMDISYEYQSHLNVQKELVFTETLIESLPFPIFYKDSEGLYKFFNHSFEVFLGKKRDEIMNKSVFDVAPKEFADIYYKADTDLMASKEKQVYESKVLYADDSLHDVLFTKVVHLSEINNAIGIVGIMQDITEQRVMEKELTRIHKANEIFLDMNHNMLKYQSESVFMHDILVKFKELITGSLVTVLFEVRDNNQISLYDSAGINRDYESLNIDFEDSYIHKMTQGDYSHAYLVNNVSQSDLNAVDPGLEVLKHFDVKSVLLIPILLDKNIKWFYSYISSEENKFNEYDITIGNYIQDELNLIIQLFHLYQKTLSMSRYDGLTGLMNRQYFDDTLYNAIRNYNDFELIIIDMDQLKLLNDTKGHQMGDFYITTLSDLLKNEFNKLCSFGRIGGDEFAGLIIGYDNLTLKLEQLRADLSHKMYEVTKGSFSYSFSYGCSTFPIDGHNYKALFKAADKRMYRYKNIKRDE